MWSSSAFPAARGTAVRAWAERPARSTEAFARQDLDRRAPVAQPDRVSVRLRSTASVWVCLISDHGPALVNGETLTADEARGPFEARAFEVTFGNGSMQMEVDDEPVEVPGIAEPIGYRITPRGVSELDPSSRPTCL